MYQVQYANYESLMLHPALPIIACSINWYLSRNPSKLVIPYNCSTNASIPIYRYNQAQYQEGTAQVKCSTVGDYPAKSAKFQQSQHSTQQNQQSLRKVSKVPSKVSKVPAKFQQSQHSNQQSPQSTKQILAKSAK
jgi:hypothetical protein